MKAIKVCISHAFIKMVLGDQLMRIVVENRLPEDAFLFTIIHKPERGEVYLIFLSKTAGEDIVEGMSFEALKTWDITFKDIPSGWREEDEI